VNLGGSLLAESRDERRDGVWSDGATLAVNPVYGRPVGLDRVAYRV
jgi:hypothetical protein